MAEILVEDFFASEGGAADDSTDCTAAIVAAIDAAMATNGGTIVFPTGICRMGQINKVFAGNEGHYKFRGDGDAVIRFPGAGYNRFGLNSTTHITFEDLVFLGNTAASAPFEEATNAIFLLSGVHFSMFKRCSFYAMGTTQSTGLGVIYSNAGMLMLEDCGFYGCFGSSVVNGNVSNGMFLKRVKFPDYGNYGGVYMSKTPIGVSNWVRQIAGTQANAMQTSTLYMEGCLFDEGANQHVRTNGVRYVTAKNCSTNSNVFGSGTHGNWHIEGALDADLKNCFWGYNPNGPITAVKAIDVGRLRIEGSYLQAGVNRIELAGSTRAGEFINNRVGGQENGGPEGRMTGDHIINTAEAMVTVDGIGSKGDRTQIG